MGEMALTLFKGIYPKKLTLYRILLKIGESVRDIKCTNIPRKSVILLITATPTR